MIREKNINEKPVVDLTGSDGNAFVLIGHARNFARQLGLNSKAISDEMMSGDYESLINTFEKYFGDFIILER